MLTYQEPTLRHCCMRIGDKLTAPFALFHAKIGYHRQEVEQTTSVAIHSRFTLMKHITLALLRHVAEGDSTASLDEAFRPPGAGRGRRLACFVASRFSLIPYRGGVRALKTSVAIDVGVFSGATDFSYLIFA